MKQLAKKELVDLIYNKALEVTKLNIDVMTQNISKSLKGVNDYNVAIVNAMAAYGSEIEKECCNIMAETLYEILYSE